MWFNRTYSKNALLDRVRYRELMDVNIALLAQPVRTVERLILEGWVPPEIDENHIVAARKVQTYMIVVW